MKVLLNVVLSLAALVSATPQQYNYQAPQQTGRGSALGAGSAARGGGAGSSYGAPGLGSGGNGGAGSGYSSGGLGSGGSGGAGRGYSGGGISGSGGDGGPSAPAQYSFQYDVSDAASGNNFGHSESRDGSRAEGKYYVLLPDTRLMTVEYFADETGYHPTVTFEGEAQFPEQSGSNQYNQQPSGQYSQPSGSQFGQASQRSSRPQQPQSQYQQPSLPSQPSQSYGQPSY
ncbi:UNVERIFIED_CONTAM: hypothetical protein RMT77_009588 [Armadillidium vulgare]